ncbi:hypothetical protein AU194_20980 [Mycobacterium sp. GA-2829]|nr:hypothetical protein AU194_20980 [Mycobacterium sp. GA-2829]
MAQEQPALGLAGCGGFVVLSAFALCFHSTRLLYLVWVIAVAALAVVVWRSAQTDVAMAVASAALFLMTNIFVAFTCHTLLGLIDRTDHYGDIEPVTGLLTRDAFFDRVATLIHARSRVDDRFLVMMAVALDGFSVLAATSTAAETDRARGEGCLDSQTLSGKLPAVVAQRSGTKPVVAVVGADRLRSQQNLFAKIFAATDFSATDTSRDRLATKQALCEIATGIADWLPCAPQRCTV